MRNYRILASGMIALFGLSLAAAQDALDEQTKLLSKRAAEADAYRKLAECVYGLQINSATYVKDFVAESDDIRTEVDTLVRGVRLGTPIWYEDGSCEVPAEVTVAKVVETLRTAHDRHYKGSSVKTSDFESITRRIEKNVIKVVGMGAPREEPPPSLPADVAESLGYPPESVNRSLPDIWRKIGPQARLMAQRAARTDAQRRLAERIKGLRLTSRTLVRDFAAESDVITTELDAFLKGAFEVGPYYHHHDELIVEVKMRIPTEQVITAVKTLHSRLYKGDDIEGSDIEKITKTIIKKDFDAVGMGVPRPEYIRRYAAQNAPELPAWSMEEIAAEGEGTDPEIETPQGKLRAARAAELDARRKLAERIAGLTIRSETVVRDFVTEHDYIATQVDAVIVDALVAKTVFSSDTATVTVAVPGIRVWSVFNEELRREARR
ncbi:MAG: LPP20 family lipoprotein [Planctomycetes bacterium]|nr:LPP20 family lipoprotein [Planctomycetota bacterium]